MYALLSIAHVMPYNTVIQQHMGFAEYQIAVQQLQKTIFVSSEEAGAVT